VSGAGQTTGGMEGDYDAHSEYQRRVVEGGEAALRQLAGELDLEQLAAGGTFTVVDYGAGTGGTSVRAMRTAIDSLDERGLVAPVAAIHNDVPTSDFSHLFRTATGPDGYAGRTAAPAYPMAAAGSFFGRVVPDDSAALGMCSNAAHWLREHPEIHTPFTMYFADAEPEARLALALAAAADWLAFCEARAAELVAGGGLLVQGIATVVEDGHEHASATLLLERMWQVASELADEQLLERGALRRYVFPVYCRSVEEATAPFAPGGPLTDEFEVLAAKVDEVPDPYWEMLQITGDREAYARTYTAFVRAFSESTLRTFLFEPAARGIDPAELTEEFFRRFEAATAADPEGGRYECWILRLTLRRR
jgi:hypothetical protein